MARAPRCYRCPAPRRAKVGGEINRARDILDNPALFSGSYVYTSALTFGQDLLNPASKSYSSYQQAFGLPGLDFATIDWSAYAQDQWRMRRNLTLNYGIRWDYEQLPDPLYPNPAIPETTTINHDKELRAARRDLLGPAGRR